MTIYVPVQQVQMLGLNSFGPCIFLFYYGAIPTLQAFQWYLWEILIVPPVVNKQVNSKTTERIPWMQKVMDVDIYCQRGILFNSGTSRQRERVGSKREELERERAASAILHLVNGLLTAWTRHSNVGCGSWHQCMEEMQNLSFSSS